MISKHQLANFDEYSQIMAGVSQLRRIDEQPRKELLTRLYRLARLRCRLEEWAESERSEAPELRRWGKFLSKSQPHLRKALTQLTKIASIAPKPSEIELFFDTEEFRFGIIKVATRLAKSDKLARELQSTLAALIHPKLRSKADKTLVKKELIDHFNLSPKPKSSAIIHWFIVTAASRLDDYGDNNDKEISRYDRVISVLFKAAFGEIVTEENVRTVLHRLRLRV